MKSPTMLLITLGTVGALTFATATADGQRIQRFDDEAGGSPEEGVSVPGAPAPAQPEPQTQQVAPPDDQDGGEDDGEEGPTGSFRISIHGEDGSSSASRPGSADPSEFADRDNTELYRGIIPGERDEVEHLRQVKEDGESSRGPNPITWVGFQPDTDRTRVFFQAPRAVQYQLEERFEDNELVLVFQNARISDRNFSRFIDASHFGRVVERIEAVEDGGNVNVTLTVSDDVEPSISTDGEYLYLDFPHDAEAGDTRAEATSSGR